MSRVWVEKFDIVKKTWESYAWPQSQLPKCIKRLQVVAEPGGSWFTMIQALVEEVPTDHPLGVQP